MIYDWELKPDMQEQMSNSPASNVYTLTNTFLNSGFI